MTQILLKALCVTGQTIGIDAQTVAKFTSTVASTAGTQPYQDGSRVGYVPAAVLTMETRRLTPMATTLSRRSAMLKLGKLNITACSLWRDLHVAEDEKKNDAVNRPLLSRVLPGPRKR